MTRQDKKMIWAMFHTVMMALLALLFLHDHDGYNMVKGRLSALQELKGKWFSGNLK